MFNIKRNFIFCKGKLIDLSATKIMGILNLTPDSFYDGGKYDNISKIINHVDNMIKDGALFIDIGGYSTKPGFLNISVEEELSRIINPLKIIIRKFPKIYVSIDTFRSEVALQCLHHGAHLINDVSGGSIEMFHVLNKYNVPYILTHSLNYFTNNRIISKNNNKNNIHKMNCFFFKKIKILKKFGINNIILDPGFGFNKNIKHNFEIIKNLNSIGYNKYPTILGISRKKSLQKILKMKHHTCSLLNATTIMHVLAIINKVSLLRVHDVKEAVECVKLVNYYSNI